MASMRTWLARDRHATGAGSVRGQHAGGTLTSAPVAGMVYVTFVAPCRGSVWLVTDTCMSSCALPGGGVGGGSGDLDPPQPMALAQSLASRQFR